MGTNAIFKLWTSDKDNYFPEDGSPTILFKKLLIFL
jgi:hypothetical protein